MVEISISISETAKVKSSYNFFMDICDAIDDRARVTNKPSTD